MVAGTRGGPGIKARNISPTAGIRPYSLNLVYATEAEYLADKAAAGLPPVLESGEIFYDTTTKSIKAYDETLGSFGETSVAGANKTDAVIPPTVNDDDTLGYTLGSRWVDTVADNEWVCFDGTTGAAVWKSTTISGGGGGAINTASNVGTGQGVFKDISPADNLRFYEILAGDNMAVNLVGDDIVLTASASASTTFTFWPSAPVQAGTVFKVWDDLIAQLNGLPVGTAPVITFYENFTIPSAGMPVGGWDMMRGTWKGTSLAGGVLVVIPDGVTIDRLNYIDYGLSVEGQPTTADGTTLTWSDQTGPGSVRVLVMGISAELLNTGTKALITSDGTGQATAFGLLYASTGDLTLSAPWLLNDVADSVIAVQFANGPFGGLPEEWLAGDAAFLQYQNGIEARDPALTSYTGPAPVILNATASRNLNYDDALNLPTIGAATAQEAFDYLKSNTELSFDSTPSLGGNLDGVTFTARNLGDVMVGASSPTTASVGLEVQSTTKAFVPSRMTTAQRDALTATAGMQIWNTDTVQMEAYDGAVWAAMGGGGGVTNPLTANLDTDTFTIGSTTGPTILDIGASELHVQHDIGSPGAIELHDTDAPPNMGFRVQEDGLTQWRNGLLELSFGGSDATLTGLGAITLAATGGALTLNSTTGSVATSWAAGQSFLAQTAASSERIFANDAVIRLNNVPTEIYGNLSLESSANFDPGLGDITSADGIRITATGATTIELNSGGTGVNIDSDLSFTAGTTLTGASGLTLQSASGTDASLIAGGVGLALLQSSGNIATVRGVTGVSVIADTGNIQFWDGDATYLQVEPTRIRDFLPHQFFSVTTAQRDALSPSEGWMIYNSTTVQLEKYQAGSWQALGGAGTVSFTGTRADNEIVRMDGAGNVIQTNATANPSIADTGVLTATTGVTTEVLRLNAIPGVITGVNSTAVIKTTDVASAVSWLAVTNAISGGNVILAPASSAGTPHLSLQSASATSNVRVTLGDTAGATAFDIRNSTPASRFSFASDGTATFTNGTTTSTMLGNTWRGTGSGLEAAVGFNKHCDILLGNTSSSSRLRIFNSTPSEVASIAATGDVACSQLQASSIIYSTNTIVSGDTTASNASVGLEVDWTTRCFLNARQTTAEVNAMTPLAGMQVYDTDTTRMKFYESATWVSFLHDLEQDTTPTLGGNLDVSTFALTVGATEEVLKFTDVASAVNEITVANAATGNNPSVQATGGDTNIGLTLTTKGTGVVSTQSALVVGATTPTNASVGIEVQSTTKAFLLSNLTSTQRDALTATAGMVIYNTTLSKMQVYTTAWETVTSI